MARTKSVKIEKNEIIQHIEDLRVNFNSLRLVKRAFVKRKREGLNFNFSKNGIKRKKADIININKNKEMSGTMVAQEGLSECLKPTGSVDTTSVKMILSELVLNKCRGVLKVLGDNVEGEVRMLDGNIVYVTYGKEKGEKGFLKLVNTLNVKTEFVAKETIKKTKNINKSTLMLIKRELLPI